MRLARLDGRANDELRSVRITPGVQRYPEGSALIDSGETRVLCAVSVEDRVPPFLKGTGTGWITAEYAMLPRATESRTQRGQERGRSQEIQRLIGRSLRAVADLNALGERTFLVDCDVLQADGGTRTAAITAGYVAVVYATQTLMGRGELSVSPLKGVVAATSVGLVEGTDLLDLCYEEDSNADVDFNIVMNDAGKFIEVQGTGEGRAFSRSEMDSLLSLAEKGVGQLFHIQRAAIEEIGL